MGRKRRRHEVARHLPPHDEPAAEAEAANRAASPINERKRHCVNGTGGPLTPQEIEAFVRDGFVRLHAAFSRETAAACRALIWRRLAADGILENDAGTWVERHGIPEIYTEEDDPIWGCVLTERLERAVDQLCGAGAWEKFGCGWWMITFPGQSAPPWGAAGKWHVDGAAYQHHVDSRESGLLAIMCFSDIAPTEGGTALAVGSHAHVARLLAAHEPRGLKGGAVSFHARQFPRERVEEVTCSAGDVVLVHPFVLHARSKNLGLRGVDSVRMMCNPNIRLHEKLQLARADGAYTPVEQFVNSYSSLFYVAFIKNAAEGNTCKGHHGGCMDELMLALGIIFVLRLTSGNFFEVGLPWLRRTFARSRGGGSSELMKNAVRREPSEVERQMQLDVYDQKGTFDDYNEMIIQFGYVTLFVVGFPLAPALALLNNYFEIRIDAHKLVNATRRPDPRGAQDIGTWGTIIEIMSAISVITNVALVCFTSKRTTEALSEYDRLWLFVGVEHGLILLKYALMAVVDDEPRDITLQKQRTKFIEDKIVNLIADDDDVALAKGNHVRVDLTVFDEDL